MWRENISQMAARHQAAAALTADRIPSRDEARFRERLRGAGSVPLDYVVLLGLDAGDFRRVVEAIERGLPYRAFQQLLAATGFEYGELAALVDIPRRTLTRRKEAGRFPPNESDRLLRAARVFRVALSLYDDDREAARDWLRAPQRAFGGIVPLRIAHTDVGAREIEMLVWRLEHGVFP